MFDTYPHIRYFVDLHSYSEAILYSRKIALELAHTMRDAIKASRGRVYRTEQAMTLYPTAGTSDDDAFSRHSVDAKQVKIFSYTIELGGPQNPTPFHPPYPEMKQIIEEVTSDLQRSVSRRSRAGYGGCRADWIRSAPCQPRHVAIPKPFTTSIR